MRERSIAAKPVCLNRLDDLPDHYAFFVALVVGGAGIALFKEAGMSQISTTAFPVVIMAAYAGIAYVTKRFRLRADRVGENLYYLGFLYTLISLAISLIQFETSPDVTHEIITNFGVAIFTTIFGLGFRVLFYQMREDPVEYE